MDSSKIKSDVLQKLIDMMDSKMVDGLKSRSPKFMKVETNDTEMAKEVVTDALDSEESLPKELSEPMPEELSEPKPEDEDLQRLLEVYRQLK